MQVTMLSVSALRPHLKNPRGEAAPNDTEIAELAESIRQHGFLAPLVVTKEDATILAGHRRRLAAVRLGLKEVPCYVVDGGAAKSLEVLLADNLHHAPVDPILESDAVAHLLSLDGWQVTDVAHHLGKSVRWVAQRRAIAGLSEAWRARFREEPWSAWPPRAMELIATISTDAQDAFFKANQYYLRDAQPRVERIQEKVAEWTRRIGTATFDPLDPDLLPAAGACLTCPKTSQASPGLFDDGEPVALDSALCLDAKCWDRKCGALLKRRVKEASEKAGQPVVVVQPQSHYGPTPRGAGVRVLSSFSYADAKKGEKGAVPAITATGKATQVKWVKPRSSSDGPSSPRSKPTTASRKVLERQWHAQVDEKFREFVLKAIPKNPPAHDVVLGLVAVFGVATPWKEKTKPITCAAAYALGRDHDAWAAAVWPYVRQAINDEPMGVRLSDADYGNSAQADAVLCQALGLDTIVLRDQAEDATPKPKALLASPKEAKPKAQTKAKGKAKAKRRAAKVA